MKTFTEWMKILHNSGDQKIGGRGPVNPEPGVDPSVFRNSCKCPCAPCKMGKCEMCSCEGCDCEGCRCGVAGRMMPVHVGPGPGGYGFGAESSASRGDRNERF